MHHRLICHPDTPSRAIAGIEIELTPAGGCARLCYRVFGRIDALRLPAAAAQPDVTELWRDTCFEMFVRTAGAAGYYELNLSPSGKWIQFVFSSYRERRGVLRTVAPGIETSCRHDQFELSGLGALPGEGPWRIGLSAILEDADGTKSYWALAHPPGKPDFHHPDCFALELPAPERP